MGYGAHTLGWGDLSAALAMMPWGTESLSHPEQGPWAPAETRDQREASHSSPGRRRWSVSLSPPAGSLASLLPHLPAQKLLGSHLSLPGG